MHTEVVPVHDVNRDRAALEQAARIIRAGGLVAFPTETVYGIGANGLDGEAVSGIFRAKGRPQDNPLILHVAALEEIEPLTTAFPASARALAEVCWPGPLTMILPKDGCVPSITSANLDTVAIRMPSHPVARALIHMAGVPVAAPSANRSGGPSPTNAAHCIADLTGRVDMILDGGECEVGLESTVVSLAGPTPRLLRPGAVTVAELERILGEIEIDPAVTGESDANRPVSSPGMKYKHYAPAANITIVHGGIDKFIEFAGSRKGCWFLVFDEDLRLLPDRAIAYGSVQSPESQGRKLFSALRDLDARNAKTVYARAPGTDGVGLAVYNRLLRAAAFRELYL